MSDDPNSPATKGDLANVTIEVTSLGAELQAGVSGLRGELKSDVAELGAEIKSDIAELRAEIVSDISTLRSDIDSKISSAVDQIVRAIQVSEENIRKDSVHVDEHTDTNNRVSRIEKHLGIESH